MAETTNTILDAILIPRPNGSENLAIVGNYLKQFLSAHGADVSVQTFTATPYGFQLVWTVVLLLMLGYVLAIARKAYGLALALCVVTPLLLLAEFEFLKSPVSGLLSAEQENIIGEFAGAATGDMLVFVAHYDTATHFGDHFSWGFWGAMQGPAQALAFLLVAVGFWSRRKQFAFPNAIAVPAALLVVLPFAAMFWFQSIGPLVRAESPGAIDNGGSMAALLLLAEKLADRRDDAPTTVRIVFVSAEEERTQGSWAYARELAKEAAEGARIRVINLESIGASTTPAYIPEDGFATRRYFSSPEIIAFVNDVAQAHLGDVLQPRELPFGTVTDGRSFLAHDIEAITLRSYIGDSFPRQLHSEYDSRYRLTTGGIEQAAGFLLALIEQADQRDGS